MIARRLLVAAGAAIACACACAQEAVEPEPMPDLAPSVSRLLEATYLTEDERESLRIEHGQWTGESFWKIERFADALLIVGLGGNGAFDDAGLAVNTQAEAALIAGDAERVLEILGPREEGESAKREILRAEAFVLTGRTAEALAAAERVAARDWPADEDESYWRLRAMVLALDLSPTSAERSRGVLQAIAEHRQRDQLDWRVRLLEAELLVHWHNREEAAAALSEALALNPRSGAAWSLLGRLMVDSLQIEKAKSVASRLDALAQDILGDGSITHPEADLIRARAGLRVDDFPLVESSITSAINARPSWREALAVRAAASAAQARYADADAELAALDMLMPGSEIGPLEVGAALSDQRQYAVAAEYLEEAADRAPGKSGPLIELGLLEMQSGRDTRALDALAQATELDPLHVRAANSLKLIRELLSYEIIETPHFRIRYRAGEDVVWARDMEAHVEAIHEQVAGLFGHSPRVKTTLELMPDHEWFSVRITGDRDLFTIAAATGPVIALEAPRVGIDHRSEYFWRDVVRHEYIHTVTLDKTDNRIPIWFTEAAAVTFQGDEPSYATWQLLASALEKGELFGPDQINLAFARPAQRPLAYPQAAWMYRYIRERWGDDAIREMMALQQQSLAEPEIFERALGVPQESFFDSFEAWARKDLESIGMRVETGAEELLTRAMGELPEAGEQAADALAALGQRFAMQTIGVESYRSYVVPPARPTPEILRALLEDEPGHPQLLSMLVSLEVPEDVRTLTDEQVELLETYTGARPVDGLPHRLLSLHYRETGEAAKLIPHLEWLDARQTNTWAYAAELARLHASLGRHDRSLHYAERAVIGAAYRPELRELAAAAAVRTRALDTAIRHVEALTVLEPDVEIHRRRLARLRELVGG